jgi:hypothetical protein
MNKDTLIIEQGDVVLKSRDIGYIIYYLRLVLVESLGSSAVYGMKSLPCM